ncbi:MAG: hypothetical protein AVDCRST_MAG17-1877, partial [uncultured Solirubrobacterales bacterium]
CSRATRSRSRCGPSPAPRPACRASRAKWTALWMSSADSGKATAEGRWSAARFHARRASFQVSSPSAKTCP